MIQHESMEGLLSFLENGSEEKSIIKRRTLEKEKTLVNLVKTGDVEKLVHWLEKENVDVRLCVPALQIAAEYNNFQMVYYLLKNGFEKLKELSELTDNNDDITTKLSKYLKCYGALASPAYICFTSDDPVTTAFERSNEIDDLMSSNGSHSVYEREFLMLKERVEDFTVDFLDLCIDKGEITTLLHGYGKSKTLAWDRHDWIIARQAIEKEQVKAVADHSEGSRILIFLVVPILQSIWITSMLISVIQRVVIQGPRKYFSSIWNMLDISIFGTTLVSLVWTIFGEVVLKELMKYLKEGSISPSIDYDGITASTTSYSIKVSIVIAIVLYGLFCILAVLILLNLCIAMMSTTYSKIEKDIDREWKFVRTSMWMDYIRGPVLAPPVNLIYIMYIPIGCMKGLVNGIVKCIGVCRKSRAHQPLQEECEIPDDSQPLRSIADKEADDEHKPPKQLKYEKLMRVLREKYIQNHL
ncbi:uncharacterized protein LOC144439382 [Glandiceps talaboti]